MISAFLGLIFAGGLVALIAIGMAFLLDVTMPTRSTNFRAILAACVAGFLPMLLPIAAILGATEGQSMVIALIPLLIGAVLLALLIGFPVALWFSRKRESSGSGSIDSDTFK